MIKKLMKSIREYKKYALLTPVIVGGEVVLEVLVPYFKTHKPKTIEIPGTGGEAVHKPHKKYRGGWQLLVMREFRL